MSKFFMGCSLASLVLVSGIAQARYIGPLLVKEASTGFTPPEYSRTEKCEIFADRTVITTNFGGEGNLVSKVTKNQTLDGNYTGLLQKARKTRPVSEHGAVDGPSVKYYGFIINANDSTTKVTLYDENGGTGTILSNTSSEARLLRNVIDALCPNTLQGIGPAPLQ